MSFDTKTAELYHARLMAASANPSGIINNLEFARKGLVIHGIMPVLQFSRLLDGVCKSGTEIEYRLSGSIGSEGEPQLRLELRGKFRLICQRCLDEMDYSLSTDSSYILVSDDAETEVEEDEAGAADHLPIDAQMSVADLIEDEILLSLPIAPKHDAQDCVGSGQLDKLKKPSPFAQLEALKARGLKPGKSQNQ